MSDRLVRNSMKKQNIDKSLASPIIIDEEKGFVFKTEKEMFQHFDEEIKKIEKEFDEFVGSGLKPIDLKIESEENLLTKTLDRPDEIWVDEKRLNHPFRVYIKEFNEGEYADDNYIFYVALSYMTGELPSFVYLHFATKDLSLVEKYQTEELIYDRLLDEAPLGALEGDALLDGDDLAIGLYQAMLQVRAKDDIQEADFRSYSDIRERGIEEADEIWRNNDFMGNTLVTFIKEFSDENPSFYYIVITIEESEGNSHSLLFSFPTKDKTLLTRYRRGENLQAEEVVQEESH